MHNSLYKKIFFFVLLFIVLFQPLSLLFQAKDSLFERSYSERFEMFKKLYYNSQYVKKINPGIIPDEALESFAGGIFLKGLNPILIIHDQPPLGRYIISLSIVLFDNATTIPIFLLLISVFGLFLIARLVLRSALLALIPVGVFINQQLFLHKFNYLPLLEPIQWPFIIFALYFFIKAQETKKYFFWLLLTAIMIGFVISIRFFILGFVLTSIMFIYLLLVKEYKKVIIFLCLLPVSIIILIASYAKTLQSGYTLLQIMGIQKYIFTYHKAKFILPFTVWDLLLFNKWHTWWGNRAILSDPEWSSGWSFSFISSFLLGALFLYKKIKISSAEKIIGLWVIGYLAMLSVGYVSTRYFLPLIPFLYILCTSFIVKFIKVFYLRYEK